MNRKEFNEKYLNITKEEFVLKDKIKDIKKIKNNLKFYKYYDLKDKYTIENIENGIIHFSNPQKFNDPFDCACGIDFDRTLKNKVIENCLNECVDDGFFHQFFRHQYENDLGEEEISNIGENILNELGINEKTINDLNEKQVKEKILKYVSSRVHSMTNNLEVSETEFYEIFKELDIFNNYNLLDEFENNCFDYMKKFFNIFFRVCPNINFNHELEKLENYFTQYSISLKKLIVKNVGVTCFSENYDNSLMWAHYSNKHSGICVEYEFELTDDVLLESIFPVEYRYERPVVTKELSLSNKILSKHILHSTFIKSKDWKYEKEWRILLPINILKDGQNFKTPKIKRIFFGINVNDEDFDKYKNRILKIDSNIECIKLRMHYKKYKIGY